MVRRSPGAAYRLGGGGGRWFFCLKKKCEQKTCFFGVYLILLVFFLFCNYCFCCSVFFVFLMIALGFLFVLGVFLFSSLKSSLYLSDLCLLFVFVLAFGGGFGAFLFTFLVYMLFFEQFLVYLLELHLFVGSTTPPKGTCLVFNQPGHTFDYGHKI